MKLVAPNGRDITGTVENIPYCEAGLVNRGIFKNKDGTYDFDYSGDTEVNWDGQYTVKNRRGSRLFYDEDGNVWSEKQLKLVEE